jgi:membrane protein YdbS with pleckstrin-like domain
VPTEASIADGAIRQLDPRYISLQRKAGWIFAGVVAGGSLLFTLFAALSEPSPARMVITASAWIVGNGLLAWHVHRWPELEYRRTSYRVDARAIEIQRGVYWRKIINVPRSRVQHTDVSQGPLARAHGLGTLVIYTAGTEHAKVELPGLAYETAMLVREHLLPREASDAV